MAGRTTFNNNGNKRVSAFTSSASRSKSDLGEIISQKKNTSTKSKLKPSKDKSSAPEEDHGFVFQRRNPIPSTLQVAKPEKPAESQAASKVAALLRRKSSIGGLKVSTRRHSSFGIGLSSKLPPASVKAYDYYKHLLPDLPGPVKMRQLMVWAVQKALQLSKQKKIEAAAEAILQALLKNELETSWYNRSSNPEKKSGALKHPQNIELEDTIAQVKQYHSSYEIDLNIRLCDELQIWQSFDKQPVLPVVPVSESIPAEVEELQSFSVMSSLQASSSWLTQLPISIDGLEWSLRLAGTFADRSKDFCEDIFKQIFARFFSEESTAPSIDPLLVLKALSSKSNRHHINRQSRRKSILPSPIMEIDG